jgi:sialic acid synthase SpsE
MKKNIHDLIKYHKTLFLPDISTFFNDDIKLALKMVDQLADAGIPVIKAEVLHDAEICLKSNISERYYSHSQAEMIEENFRDVIERKVVSLDSYARIFDHIKKRNCELVVSVYDNKGVDFAIEQDVVAIKIASSNITHQPLLKYVANTKKTIILDTGHSTLEEIARAVNWLNDAGKSDIIIQHSPLPPPTPVDKHNLKFMQTLGRCFQLPYGLSDHHFGDEMLFAATALGACIVEKGVCPDETRDDQDRAHALNISEAKIVQLKVKNIAEGLGGGIRRLERSREKYHSRMGLIAKQDIKKGDVLTHDNIGFAFPPIGLEVEYIEIILGKNAQKSISKGQPILFSDL